MCPSFRMEDGTEIRNSCWRLQEQTVNGEATGAHAGRHAAFTATCYFCWFLFIVNWTLKKDHPKINIAFFTSPLLGGSRVLQRRILAENVLNGFWTSCAGPWWEAGTRWHLGNAVQSREEARVLLGPCDLCTHSPANAQVGGGRAIGLIAEKQRGWVSVQVGVCSPKFCLLCLPQTA